MRKLVTCALACGLMLMLTAAPAGARSAIPEKMEPSTIIVYDENCQPITSVMIEPTPNIRAESGIQPEEDTSGREEEDAMVAALLEEMEGAPVYIEEAVLPDPEPGMRVIYGTDGYINHIYSSTGEELGTIGNMIRVS